MNTRKTKKNTDTPAKNPEVDREGNIEPEPSKSPGGQVDPILLMRQWRSLSAEFDENLNEAVNLLAAGRKERSHQVLIYFENIMKTLSGWAERYLRVVGGEDGERIREFPMKASPIAEKLKTRLVALRDHGTLSQLYITVLDYQAFSSIEKAALETRRVPLGSEEGSVHSRRRRSVHSPSSQVSPSGPRRLTTHHRRGQHLNIRSRSPSGGRSQSRGRNWTHDHYESEDLLRELRRYGELPPPWNKTPGQSVRQERLDVSRQVQLAGDRVFKGEVDDYLKWRDYFISTIGDVRCLARHKVNALRRSLDSVLETIVDYVPATFEGYKEIIENLEKAYGGTFRQMARYDDFFDTFKVKYNVIDQFRDFCRKAAGYKALLTSSGDRRLFYTPHIYRHLLVPLPGGHIRELQTWLHSSNLEPNAQNLLKWAQDRLDRMLTEKEVERRKTIDTKTKAAKRPTIHITEIEDESSEPEEFRSSENESEEIIINYTSKIPNQCLLGCVELHKLYECSRFLQLEVMARRNIIRSWRFMTCYNCLEFGHAAKTCTKRARCKICDSQYHHTLLHTENTKVRPTIPLINYTSKINCACLPYISIRVSKQNTKSLPFSIIAMLDTGANVTVTSNRMRKWVDESDEFTPTTLNTAGGRITKETAITKFDVWCQNEKRVPVTALTFDDDAMFMTMEPLDLRKVVEAWPHLSRIPLGDLGSSRVDLLIGNDLANLTTPLEVIKIEDPKSPVAERSALGWTIRGPVVSSKAILTMEVREEEEEMTAGQNKKFENLIQNIERAWELDRKTGDEFHTKDEKIAKSIITRTMSLQNGRVQCGILWKTSSPPSLTNNRPLAVRRLHSLHRTLEKNKKIKELYCKGIRDWIEDGILRQVSERAEYGKEYYLSHFPVVNMSKATTKVRIVVDAAARFRGTCLNDYILPGPNLANDVRRVLLRFRRGPVAIIADVQSMFTQIRLLESERSYHQILWGDPDDPKEYEFTAFTFGNTCSPSVAISAARFLATTFGRGHRAAVEAIHQSTVVDDTLDSVDSEEEAVQLLTSLRTIYSEGGMKLRKIGSNRSNVLTAFPPEDVHHGIATCLQGSHSSYEETIKTLGVKWDPSMDQLYYELEFEQVNNVTRRVALSTLARIYDPCGLITPITIKLKLLSQSTWPMKTPWDTNLPASFTQIWNATLREISGKIKFKRALTSLPSEDVLKRSVHIFCDASDKALGAVAYLTVQYRSTNLIESQIMISCSRVAPLRFTTIPRLELQAAIEAVNLAEHLSKALDLDPYAIQYWTDSTDVLHWLASASRSLKIFVASRVATIQRKSSVIKWNWVPTAHNPADLISRGCSIEKLNISTLWKEGPSFLKDESSLPLGKKMPWSNEALKERKNKKHPRIRIHYCDKLNNYWRNKLKRFSSWFHFVRAASRIVQKTCPSKNYSEICLQTMYKLVSLLQNEYLPQEYSDLYSKRPLRRDHRYANLRLFYNNDQKTLHVSGRLSSAEHLPYLTKFPFLVPEDTYWALLVVRDVHQNVLNHMGGIKTLISEVMTTFFIRKVQSLAKKVLRSCIYCRRLSFRPTTAPLAPLPYFRLPFDRRNEVFESSAMDCLGPLYVKSNVDNPKVYILVITCTFYCALHLEVIDSLSTDSFLLAFDRFIAIRNRPKVVISDNGRNFLGAWNNLEKVFVNLPEELQKRYSKIKWLFNTPLDPHKGGVFERMVGLTKENLARVLRNRKINHEELRTAVRLIEAGLNNRPLQPCQPDIDDLEILTPNHFLRGSTYNTLAPNAITLDALKQWKYTNKLLQMFWKRFINQYIVRLNVHPKKKNNIHHFKTGELVMINEKSKEDNFINFPLWPVGKITKIFPGPDGIVRSVKVIFNGKEYIRGITKIAPLHL